MTDRIALNETTKQRAKECAIMEWQLEIIQEAIGSEVGIEPIMEYDITGRFAAIVDGDGVVLVCFDPKAVCYNAKLGRDENMSFARAFDAWCTERGIVPF